MTNHGDGNWQDKHYAFFCNRECEYFPCHKTVDPDNFNCLFCYCPLYVLGHDCGGNFFYNEKGNKVCTNCGLPHIRGNYGYVRGRYKEVMERIKALENAPRGSDPEAVSTEEEKERDGE